MTDRQEPAATLRGSMRLYPELLLVENADERRALFKERWKRVRNERSIVRWGAGFGVAVGLMAGVLAAVINRFVPLHPVFMGCLVGALLGLGGAWLLRQIVHKPFQQAIRRALIERGLPVSVACGYDLRGNVSGACPECGTGIEKGTQ